MDLSPPALTPENAKAWFETAAEWAHQQRPGKISGRGITLCGGGLKYLPCVWVCINMLRKAGCTLPIEVWYLGHREMPEEIEDLLSPLGVDCIDGSIVRERVRPARILNGWELKPFAILNSRFAEVFAIDADNVVTRDPAYLFDCFEYQKHGCIFWPDYGRLHATRTIWELSGVEYRDEPEFETGQMFIDKNRCYPALSLTMAMNEYSDFWFQHIHGDKETFHMAWRKLNQSYAMPHYAIQTLDATMCQHDFKGDRLFQHRNMAKWTLGNNRKVRGFLFEEECLALLDAFRPVMERAYELPQRSECDVNDLSNRKCEYQRVGYDIRTLFLSADGRIGEGAAGMERHWSVIEQGGRRVLRIHGDEGITAALEQESAGSSTWLGSWRHFEKMPVVVRVF